MRSKHSARVGRRRGRGLRPERNGAMLNRLLGERGGAGRNYAASRRFHRWEVSIPCRYSWDDRIEDAAVSNLSFGGALLRHSGRAPAEREAVSIQLDIDGREVSLPARVVHRRWEINGEELIGYMGVAFDDPIPALRQKLLPAFRLYAA